MVYHLKAAMKFLSTQAYNGDAHDAANVQLFQLAQGYMNGCLAKGNHRALSGAATNAVLEKHFIHVAAVHLIPLKVLVYSFVCFGVLMQYSTGNVTAVLRQISCVPSYSSVAPS
jgi:hypothetical protein